MSIYHCDPEWPVCLFDFSFKNRDPNMFAFKVKPSLDDYVIPDYFQKGQELDYRS
jgi:hypothetical protein